MTVSISAADLAAIRGGYDDDSASSLSLRAEAYTAAEWFRRDRDAIISSSWQWVCHVEKLSNSGSYVAVQIAGRPIAVDRDREGEVRAFYNVCKHRAHHLLSGEGVSSPPRLVQFDC